MSASPLVRSRAARTRVIAVLLVVAGLLGLAGAAGASGGLDSPFYKGRVAATIPGPTGYWGLGETSGSTAFDHGSSGINGTFQSASNATLTRGAQGPFITGKWDEGMS